MAKEKGELPWSNSPLAGIDKAGMRRFIYFKSSLAEKKRVLTIRLRVYTYIYIVRDRHGDKDDKD